MWSSQYVLVRFYVICVQSLLGLPWNAALAATSAVGDPNTARTSIDLELDLQASQARLRQTGDDVERLKLIKQKIEKAKQDGTSRYRMTSR